MRPKKLWSRSSYRNWSLTVHQFAAEDCAGPLFQNKYFLEIHASEKVHDYMYKIYLDSKFEEFLMAINSCQVKPQTCLKSFCSIVWDKSRLTKDWMHLTIIYWSFWNTNTRREKAQCIESGYPGFYAVTAPYFQKSVCVCPWCICNVMTGMFWKLPLPILTLIPAAFFNLKMSFYSFCFVLCW